MQDPTSPPPAAPGDPPLSPQVTVTGTIQSLTDDLHDLLSRPGDLGEAEARILDRLAEETAEAAAMIRALPGRPAQMSCYGRLLLAALRTAHQAGEDLGATVARALCALAVELGGQAGVLKNRPGSWEAQAIGLLMSGTFSPDDEGLPTSGEAGGSL